MIPCHSHVQVPVFILVTNYLSIIKQAFPDLKSLPLSLLISTNKTCCEWYIFCESILMISAIVKVQFLWHAKTGFPRFGQQQIPNFHILIPNHFLSFSYWNPQLFPNQNYIVPMTFQKNNSQRFIFFQNYFAGHFPKRNTVCWFPDTFLKCNKFPTYSRLGMGCSKFPSISQIPNRHENPAKGLSLPIASH